MAFDYYNFDDRLRSIIAEGSGLGIPNVIPEQENAPAPTGLYATLLLIEETRPAWASTRLRENAAGTVDELIAITIYARYDVHFFRTNAIAAAQRFRLWLETSPGIMAMQREGFALRTPPVFRRIDELLPIPEGITNSIDIEERASIELSLSYCIEGNNDVGCIEVVPATLSGEGTNNLTRIGNDGP